MTCDRLRACGKCKSCKQDRRELKLDMVQEIVEREISESKEAGFLNADDVQFLAAGIVIELDKTHWLKVK